MNASWGLCGSIAVVCAQAAEVLQPQPLKGGVEFQSADVRAMQADAFANPGMLWVERGAALWSAARGERNVSCASCHGDAVRSMKGVAARYPAHSPALGRVVNIEQRINACAADNQGAAAFPWESQELLALTAFVARQSHGEPIARAPRAPRRLRSSAAARCTSSGKDSSTSRAPTVTTRAGAARCSPRR